MMEFLKQWFIIPSIYLAELVSPTTIKLTNISFKEET